LLLLQSLFLLPCLLAGQIVQPVGGGGTTTTDASALTTGTLNAARLPGTVTQTNQSNTFSTGTQDFSGASHTLPALKGLSSAKPATCVVGEVYFATDVTAGQNFFYCTTTNIWTQSSVGGGTSVGPTTTQLTFGSSSSLFGGTYFASTETFTNPKHLKIRALLNRSSSSVTLSVAVSSDAVHAYMLSSQSDGNLVWYYQNGSSQTVLFAAGTNNTNIAGNNYMETEYSIYSSSLNFMKAWKDGYYLANGGGGTNQGSSTDTHMDLSSGTFKVYVNIDSATNIRAIYVESW
jgi:hypothetical protein